MGDLEQEEKEIKPGDETKPKPGVEKEPKSKPDDFAAPPSKVPGSEAPPSSPQAKSSEDEGSEWKKRFDDQQKAIDELKAKDAKRDFERLCDKHGVKDAELFEFLLGKKKPQDVAAFVAELKTERPDMFSQAPLSTTTAGGAPPVDKDRLASLEADLLKAKEAGDTGKMLEITTTIQKLKK